MSDYEVDETQGPFNEHFIPFPDAIRHGGEDCICGPDVTYEDDIDGQPGLRFTHHALSQQHTNHEDDS